ncbi:MAG: type II secretion system protein, partial [Burkholderiales bacterium]
MKGFFRNLPFIASLSIGHKKHHPAYQIGYTIVELSISLSIIALLMTGGLAVFVKTNEAKRLKITHERLVVIQKALHQFAKINSYLPCPAVTSVEANAAFGLASNYVTYMSASNFFIENSDSSLNSTTTSFLGLGAGTKIGIRGFTNAQNNGLFGIARKLTNSKIVIAGAQAVLSEGAGAIILLD